MSFLPSYRRFKEFEADILDESRKYFGVLSSLASYLFAIKPKDKDSLDTHISNLSKSFGLRYEDVLTTLGYILEVETGMVLDKIIGQWEHSIEALRGAHTTVEPLTYGIGVPKIGFDIKLSNGEKEITNVILEQSKESRDFSGGDIYKRMGYDKGNNKIRNIMSRLTIKLAEIGALEVRGGARRSRNYRVLDRKRIEDLLSHSK